MTHMTLSKRIFITVVSTLCFGATAISNAADRALGNRAIWWWVSPDHAWGTDQVIGKPVKEAAVIDFLKQWNIGHVYVSFSPGIRKQPGLIRSWNKRAHAAGMKSQLLLSENTWIYPEQRLNLTDVHIRKDLIDFNTACKDPLERFDGLHLDIEPHGLPGWTTMTPAQRKTLLVLLGDTFRDVRAYLDSHGAKGLPVYADLPVWFDQPGKPVGWENAARRDEWFASLGRSLKGISMMAYERDTAPRIESGVEWEIAHFKGEVRVGLEASVGEGRTWRNFRAFHDMIELQETMDGASRKVDLHDFAGFVDVVPNKPGKPRK